MKFVREVGINNITNDILALEHQEGWTLVWHEESVELWYQVKQL